MMLSSNTQNNHILKLVCLFILLFYSKFIIGQNKSICILEEASFEIGKNIYSEMIDDFEKDTLSQKLMILQMGYKRLLIAEFIDSNRITISVYDNQIKRVSRSIILRNEQIDLFMGSNYGSYILTEENRFSPQQSVLLKYKKYGKTIASLYTTHIDTYKCLTPENKTKIGDITKLMTTMMEMSKLSWD